MADALFSAADYKAALLALLPRGRVWPKSDDALQADLAAGLAQGFARHDQRAQQLLVDAFPATTAELLPEWEQSLGLPDPCAGPQPTVAQRQAQVLARFTDTGCQSAQRFIDLAAQLGYTISIQTFARFRAGRSRAGERCYGADWLSTWRVIAPLNTITWFRAGQGRAGERIAVWGNAVLECEIRARAPAHTIVQFAYVGLQGTLNFSDPNQSAFLGVI